jgi:SAM-dependent methyltransferase
VPGLFVLWDAVRRHESEILADLQRRFRIVSVTEVEWTPRRVERNYERFYSDLDVRGVYHVLNKGAGPSLAVVLWDPDPIVEVRVTSRGPREVNANFLDAKLRYRHWCGGLGVHCGETPHETRRDLAMLLGEPDVITASPRATWDGRIERIARDVTGSDGWESELDMYRTLNATIDYVVLPRLHSAGTSERSDVAHRVQLLCDDYHSLHTILGARPDFGRPADVGGGFTVRVGGRPLCLGVRFVGDRFIDPSWASECLRSRVLGETGIFELDHRNAGAVALYRSLIHRCPVSGPDAQLVSAAAEVVDPSCSRDLGDDAVHLRRSVLDRFLSDHGYAIVEPLDPFVPFVDTSRGRGAAAFGQAHGSPRRLMLARHHIAGRGRMTYLRVHDRLIRRHPSIRRLKQLDRRPPGMSFSSLPRRAAGRLRGHGAAALKAMVLLVRGVVFTGRRYVCPCCGWSLRGFVGRWGTVRTNSDGYCPRCNAKARHRRLWLHLEEHGLLRDGSVRLLEIAPWPSLARGLRRLPGIAHVGIDLRSQGRHVDVVGDARFLPVRPGSFDIALCIHVLEHVDDDLRVMSELRRSLGPDGVAIVSVPLRMDAPTHENPSITDPVERERLFGERGHVRLYGPDLRDRLESSGFEVRVDWATGIDEEIRRRHGLRTDEHLFVCRPSKPELRSRCDGLGAESRA